MSYFLESRRVRIGREAFLISDDHGYELWVVDVLKYDVDVVAEHGGDGLRPAVEGDGVQFDPKFLLQHGDDCVMGAAKAEQGDAYVAGVRLGIGYEFLE